MDTILITGGSGHIGKQLTLLLKKKGFKVLVLSRKQSENPDIYFWDIKNNLIEDEAILKSDYIIHLAGAGIADKRWTKKRKKELIDSRVASTNLLFKKIKELNHSLNGFIAASGIGYYGAITSEKVFSETDNAGDDFLAKICKLWEKSSSHFSKINTRTVIFRTGVVFSKNGGALEKMSHPIKLGFGSSIGNGKQYIPWIHIDDLCKMYLQAIIDPNLNGIYNAVAPESITNKELTLEIAKNLHKKIWVPPIPAFVFKIIFGEMGNILLEGSRVSSNKITRTGFKFQYRTLSASLKNLQKS